MAKVKTIFICSDCGYESSRWMGKCPACTNWNTLIEETVQKNEIKNTGKKTNAILLNDVNYDTRKRVKTDMHDFDRVLGGGIVAGSLILLGGAPGIGKSTLLLQICNKLSGKGKMLYISGEESEGQIKLRADRLKVNKSEINLLCETLYDSILYNIDRLKPDFLVIDSIQTVKDESLTSPPGSISQIKFVTEKLIEKAKSSGITIFLIGHITKEGDFAGPKVLEHMVDAVFYFEGDKTHDFRVLRSMKNRYGSTNEIALFEMHEDGLEEVLEPAHVLLDGRPTSVPGTAVVTSMEGTRPLLLEIQALVTESKLAIPRRMSTGIDPNRVNLLMAVLEKKAGFHLYNYDTYINVVGGLKIIEPACDLGVVSVIASSLKNRAVPENTVMIGELGLTGEVRAVNNIAKRINEAEKLGFTNCILPYINYNKMIKDKKSMDRYRNIEFHSIKNIQELLSIIFK